MERERLTRLLEEPGKVAREDLVGLKAMAERYPWFGGAHLLLATGEHAAGDVLFDDTLATSSAHIPSRVVLFDHLHRLPELVTPGPITNEVPPLAAVLEPPPAQPQEVISEPIAPIEGAAAVEPEPPAENVVMRNEEPKSETNTVVTDVQEPVQGDVLEKQILEAALASAYDLTWQERVAEPFKPAHVPDVELKEAAVIHTAPPLEPVLEAPPIPHTTIAPTPRNSKLRFTEWLEEATPSVPSGMPPISVVVPLAGQDRLRGMEDAPTPTEASVHDLPPHEVIKPMSAPLPQFDTRALIDRFIQQETPPPPAKTAFFTPQQAAKRSLDDTAGLVTETLARIYAKQGDVTKAIEAYGRLALKYPEKSAYFATLQKELKEHPNT